MSAVLLDPWLTELQEHGCRIEFSDRNEILCRIIMPDPPLSESELSVLFTLVFNSLDSCGKPTNGTSIHSDQKNGISRNANKFGW